MFRVVECELNRGIERRHSWTLAFIQLLYIAWPDSEGGGAEEGGGEAREITQLFCWQHLTLCQVWKTLTEAVLGMSFFLIQEIYTEIPVPSVSVLTYSNSFHRQTCGTQTTPWKQGPHGSLRQKSWHRKWRSRSARRRRRKNSTP